jgi:hypothetical protein
MIEFKQNETKVKIVHGEHGKITIEYPSDINPSDFIDEVNRQMGYELLSPLTTIP